VPVDRVEARTLVVGDVVRLSDPQPYRIERVMIADGGSDSSGVRSVSLSLKRSGWRYPRRQSSIDSVCQGTEPAASRVVTRAY